jgi:hypothetical protein
VAKGAARSAGSRVGLGDVFTVAGAAVATGLYNQALKQRGGDLPGAAAIEGLVSGLILAMDTNKGFLWQGSAGVLGTAIATFIFG